MIEQFGTRSRIHTLTVVTFEAASIFIRSPAVTVLQRKLTVAGPSDCYKTNYVGVQNTMPNISDLEKDETIMVPIESTEF